MYINFDNCHRMTPLHKLVSCTHRTCVVELINLWLTFLLLMYLWVIFTIPPPTPPSPLVGQVWDNAISVLLPDDAEENCCFVGSSRPSRTTSDKTLAKEKGQLAIKLAGLADKRPYGDVNKSDFHNLRLSVVTKHANIGHYAHMQPAARTLKTFLSQEDSLWWFIAQQSWTISWLVQINIVLGFCDWMFTGWRKLCTLTLYLCWSVSWKQTCLLWRITTQLSHVSL